MTGELLESVLLNGWVWALSVAGAFYVTATWFGKQHLSADARDSLALWLMGANEDTWSRHFCNLFDAVFGERHLSWRCFFRSSIASVLAVLALYVLFAHVFGVLDDRMLGELELWQAIVLGAAINIVPDYISLFQTRWLLRRFDRITSIPAQVLILIADAVLSGAIIWAGVSVFHLVRGDPPPDAVEMLALFSIFSVFFYSTFLTSAWAWVYCLSTWFMRIFARTGLSRLLDVENAPTRQVGLVGGFILLIASLGFFAVSESEDVGVAQFDQFLCETLGGRSCVHAARLSNAERDLIVALDRFCSRDNLAECHSRMNEVFGLDADAFFNLFAKGCVAGSETSCLLAETVDAGSVESLAALNAQIDACKSGSDLDCSMIRARELSGRINSAGWGYYNILESDAPNTEDDCKRNDVAACLRLARHKETGWQGTRDSEGALALFKQACEAGEAEGCGGVGRMHRSGRIGGVDLERAAIHFERGCELGDAMACIEFGSMLRVGEGVPLNVALGDQLLSDGCRLLRDMALMGPKKCIEHDWRSRGATEKIDEFLLKLRKN